MAGGMFQSKWSGRYHRDHDISIKDGFLLLKVEPRYLKALVEKLKKFDEFQEKKISKLLEKNPNADIEDAFRIIEWKYEYHYKKRTLDQNRLMWSLYEIEAYILNAGMEGHPDEMITAEYLYHTDLLQYGEREQVYTKRKNLSYYRDEYTIEFVMLDKQRLTVNEALQQIKDFDQKIVIEYIRGSSKLDTREMADWIERIFNRIAYHGVPLEKSDKIKDFWIKQRDHLNKNQIVLNSDEIMTIEQYKAYRPLCEATGEFIANGGGELAHIQGFGMGGKRSSEPWKNYTWNWLHLKTEVHREIWHGKGVEFFLKQFPHLSYKVRTALKRRYEPIGD